MEYSFASCAGSFLFSGLVGDDCVVEYLDVRTKMNLPALIECNNIPDVREEIHSGIHSSAFTLMLIGRDLSAAHHFFEQRIGSGNEPFPKD